MVEKLTEAQSESEVRLLEFEEKSMKMEKERGREKELIQAENREQ